MSDIKKSEELEEAPDDSAERQEPTPYHGAAVNVIFYRLHEYEENGDVAIIDEHRLSKEPLRIDIIVVKKNREIELKPVWAKIFRGHNIIEYKSPVDNPPTLAVFDKLIGYARIYAAQEEVKISDITATIICANPPEKLFKILEDEFDYEILQKDDGIYYIMERGGAVEKRLAIQVVAQKSELLLQALDNRLLDTATADKVTNLLRAATKEDIAKLGYWLKALAPENIKNIFGRMGGDMTETEKAYLEVLESWGVTDRVMQKGRQEGALEVIALLEKGCSLEEAKKKLQLETA